MNRYASILWRNVGGAALALTVGGAAQAAALMPSFATAPTDWVTDRYAPDSFSNVGTYQGRNDVLGIGISAAQGSANRPAGQLQNDFYNTQGMKYTVAGGAGSTLAADLFVSEDWRSGANGNVRTDMWGVSNNMPLAYPIIGFTNQGGAARYRVWDGDVSGGWIDLLTAVNFGAWNAFEIEFTGTAFVYSINGTTVYTDNTIGTTTGFSGAIMQAYNFNDTFFDGGTAATGFVGGDYTAHWSNAVTAVPEPISLALVGIGLAAAGLGTRRRRTER